MNIIFGPELLFCTKINIMQNYQEMWAFGDGFLGLLNVFDT